MLLTFNVLYDKLMSEEKLQTIRLNYIRWEKFVRNSQEYIVFTPTDNPALACSRRYMVNSGDRRLQIYWRSPRVGGKKLGEGYITELDIKTYGQLDLYDARRDGFGTLQELLEALCDRNEQVIPCDTVLALIRWKWIDGPHDVGEYKR